MPQPANIGQVRVLLQEGKTQEADDLLANIAATSANAMMQKPAKSAEPPEQRRPMTIIIDFMRAVTSHLGNRGELEALLLELEAATAPPKAVGATGATGATGANGAAV